MNDFDTTSVPILEARALERVFKIDHTTIHALQGVSLRIQKGETVCIMGASGAGKSTLLYVLGGLDHPTGGQALFKGNDLYALSAKARSRVLAREIGFMFQAYHLFPELDVLENVLLPAMNVSRFLQRREAYMKRASELLAAVGLSNRMHHRPAELSGGEQQRVALARSLMNEPKLVLADEPTGNLDPETGEQVLNHLFALTRERGYTLVMVSHNETISQRCDRSIILEAGQVITRGP